MGVGLDVREPVFDRGEVWLRADDETGGLPIVVILLVFGVVVVAFEEFGYAFGVAVAVAFHLYAGLDVLALFACGQCGSPERNCFGYDLLDDTVEISMDVRSKVVNVTQCSLDDRLVTCTLAVRNQGGVRKHTSLLPFPCHSKTP